MSTNRFSYTLSCDVMEMNYKEWSSFATDMRGLLRLYVDMKGYTMDDHGIAQ